MATGTVKELEAERKREEGLRLRRELLSAMAKLRLRLAPASSGQSRFSVVPTFLGLRRDPVRFLLNLLAIAFVNRSKLAILE